MSAENQAVFLNAVPLLVLAVLYLVATGTLAPSFWRERRRMGEVESALALIFPCCGLAAAAGGVLLLRDPKPLGNTWVALAAIVVAALPAVQFLSRGGDRTLLLTGSRRAREAEQQTTALTRRREAMNAFTDTLARTDETERVARLVLSEVQGLVGVEFAALALVEEGEARGLMALLGADEVEWWRNLRLELDREASAIGAAVSEGVPVTVHDVASSPYVKREVAEALGVRSGVWLPVSTGEAVIAVLVAASTGAPRTFDNDDLELLREIAAETALALERTRSAAALAEALARERLVAELSRRLRALDHDAALQLVVEEVGTALGASRCLLRLGEGETATTGAEWTAPGVEPAGAHALRLPTPILAARERKTVEIPDVAAAAERLGDGGFLTQLGVRAVLATPIIVAGELFGVLVVHRPETGNWRGTAVRLVEGVARELGLVLGTARLLQENERRLEQQAALLAAGEAVTSELRLETVLQRLVDEVVRLLDADAADCWILDEGRGVLRCRAVSGVPASEVGRETVPEGTIAEALALGRPVLKRDFGRSERPPPSASYAGFEEVVEGPITSGGRPLGILGVCSRTAGRFGPTDLDLLHAFAHLASLALHNAELFEERSRQARIQRGFYRVASVLGRPISRPATLDAVAEAANEALGGSFAAVLMPLGTTLELAGSEALPEPLAEALRRGVPTGDGALRLVTGERSVIASPAVDRDDRFDPEWRELARELGYRSLLAIPVEAAREERFAGAVLVFFSETRLFTDDDLEVAGHLVGAARAALERSGAYEEERRARSLAQQLARTGGLLASELDPAAVLDEVVRQAPRLVGVDAAAVRVLDGDELVVTVTEGAAAERMLGSRSPVSTRLSGDVVQSRGRIAVEDAEGDERLLAADPLLGLGFRAYLGVPLAGAQGAMRGVLSVYSTRPKRWRAEEVEALEALAGNASAALANAELYQRVALEKERSVAILANIADGIVAVDREGRVVLWNAAAEQITGVPAEAAVGRTPTEALGRALGPESDTPAGNRLVAVPRGGEEVWLSLTEAVMRDPAGAVAGRIYAFRDISADRQVEQMKTDFVSSVSQELRRPLTSIYGFAETLLRRDVLFGEEERRTFLRYIASESERLTRIVDALLNAARLDAGDLQISLAPIDVGSLVSEVVSGFETAAANGHRFAVEVGSAPVARADGEKLRQVLVNLIENAVKFSPAGGTVTVAARRDGETVEVSVADEGPGIPQAEQARIFRKFTRGDVGRGGPAGGSGLGLFIVEGLVTAMGGRVWVASTEGAGSSFTLALPAAEAVSSPAGEWVEAE